jgi:protein TonB
MSRAGNVNAGDVMSTASEVTVPKLSPETGHLTVRPEGSGPVEVRFSFEDQEKRLGSAFGASILSHIAFVGLALLVVRLAPEPVREAILPDRLPNMLVFIPQEGPGGGGGGGGNKNPEPPKKAELVGKEKITVPVVKPPEPVVIDTKPEPPPEPMLNIPAKTMAMDTTTTPGVLESTQPSAVSLGTGTGGGGGTGTGTGVGPGQGSGLGPGWGGNMGGGPYRPGNGVQLPRVIREVKPQYTADAMRAKVQGIVLLECVVLPDGSVGQVEIVRSLDPTFGLDQEAIRAAKQWRFTPGTRFGEPVPVLVTIELTFTLR